MSYDYKPSIQGCRLIDNYEILQRIGKGSYGVVHRARDRQTDEIYAVKRLRLKTDTTNGVPQLILREIKALMECQDHENIIKLHEVVTNRHITKAYIVMDYMSSSLSTIIAENQTQKENFAESTVKFYLLQLLRGLDFLHEKWLMHRDLKPSNILVSKNNTLKIADFGMSRSFGKPVGDYTNLVSTLWYRAPELLFGVTGYDKAVDIWSLGCIFAEMLLLRPLFKGLSELNQIDCIFKILGAPDAHSWPDFHQLPAFEYLLCKDAFRASESCLESTVLHRTNKSGFDLLNRMLCYNPLERIETQAAMEHIFLKQLWTPSKD